MAFPVIGTVITGSPKLLDAIVRFVDWWPFAVGLKVTTTCWLLPGKDCALAAGVTSNIPGSPVESELSRSTSLPTFSISNVS